MLLGQFRGPGMRGGTWPHKQTLIYFGVLSMTIAFLE